MSNDKNTSDKIYLEYLNDLDIEYQKKKKQVFIISAVSFSIATFYQSTKLKKEKKLTSGKIAIVSILTGCLSYGITYLALRNIYEL